MQEDLQQALTNLLSQGGGEGGVVTLLVLGFHRQRVQLHMHLYERQRNAVARGETLCFWREPPSKRTNAGTERRVGTCSILCSNATTRRSTAVSRGASDVIVDDGPGPRAGEPW
jgi:hypothetical protein